MVREEWGHVLASLVGQLRDFALAEDVLQDALVAALEHWPRDGVPTRPRAWLLQTARRKAIDKLRRAANFRSKRAELTILHELDRQTRQDNVDDTIADERLRLIFTCCHPALAEATRVALTLRTLGGLTTEEIARAFLLPEPTMAQRLTRAKRKIKAAGIPYTVPEPDQWAARLGSVLSVIYLIFNEGYSAFSGDAPTRADLCQEAIRLGRILTRLVPTEPEAAGLLALMLLHDSRREARNGPKGDLITLEQQERSRWNRDLIDAGTRLLDDALAQGDPGPYQIQAAISALHAQAQSFAATDWSEITLLYNELYALQPSPVVSLNAAVALSYAQGAEAVLPMLSTLERQGALDSYQPFHAAHADILRRADRKPAAANAYRRAIALTTNMAEKRFLEGRLNSMLH
ncbi:MAG: sigma-70 family RNA polymerase sigma factor [Alphaproteobacteria bacterium]|nr:sigma-70 family RNA polymerase sigma factor [Alphaproteobacteria bacterium]